MVQSAASRNAIASYARAWCCVMVSCVWTPMSCALTSIRVAAGIVPAVFFLAAAAVMLAYPLTEKAFRAIVAEMAERRAESEAGLNATKLETLTAEEKT